MYSVVDLCLLCLTESENLKSILAQDSDGIVIEEKCNNFFNELVNNIPEISYKICLHCLKNVNYVNSFKQRCSQNIIKLNNYLNTLRNLHGSYKHLKVILKENELTYEIEKYGDVARIEILKSSNLTQEGCLESNVTVKKEVEEYILPNEFFPPIEEVIVKEEISDNCEIQDTIVTEEEESMNDGNSSSGGGDKNEKLKNQNKNSERRYKCDHCPKAFADSRHLENHNRIHTRERPFKCTTCQKTFSQLVTLNRHNRTHTGEKPYPCDVCEKAFSDKIDLNRHKRIHDNVRPFKCSVCDKTFTQSVHLTAHMKIHTKDKPFHCQYCEYKCIQRNSLKLHLRTHTGIKPYACEHCQKAFYDSRSLKRHMQKKHNDAG